MRVAIIHDLFFQHPDVGVDEIAVIAVLCLHADATGTCWPSQGLIATLLGKSRPWVCAVIARLVSLGLVEKTDRSRHDGGRRTSLYRLVGPTASEPRTKSESAAATASNPESSLSQGCDGSIQSNDRGSQDADSNKEPKEYIQQDAHPEHAHEIVSIFVHQDVAPVLQVTAPEIRVAITPEPDWQPTDDDLLFGLERFPDADLTAATERFIGRCQAKGYRYFNLSAAWRVWLAEDQAAAKQEGAARFGRGGGQRPSAAERRYDAWASVAARHASGSARHAA